MDPELKYQIALTRIDGVGCSLAKNLVRFCGSASAVFSEKRSVLKSIPGIGSITAEHIFRFRTFSDIEAEIIHAFHVHPLAAVVRFAASLNAATCNAASLP